MDVAGKEHGRLGLDQQWLGRLHEFPRGLLIRRLVEQLRTPPRRVREDDQEGRRRPVDSFELGRQPLDLHRVCLPVRVWVQRDEVRGSQLHAPKRPAEVVSTFEVILPPIDRLKVVADLLGAVRRGPPSLSVGDERFSRELVRFNLVVAREDQPRNICATRLVKQPAEAVPPRGSPIGVGNVAEQHGGVKSMRLVRRRQAGTRLSAEFGLADVAHHCQPQPVCAGCGRRPKGPPAAHVAPAADAVSVGL
mmetsp:Transcript_24566/g.69791  ORF Transcript_24566/g.69791 Transcript_24566/m.69791 type:complete len:249 (+) Transcript_24566:558-1304(+)